MLLGGLWHGAGWTFLAWGALHGVAVVVERCVRERWGSTTGLPGMTRVLGTLLTFHLVCLGWVLFRAVDLRRTGEVLAALGGSWSSAPSLDWGVLIVLLVGGATQFVPIGFADPIWSRLGRSSVVVQALVVVIAIVAMDILGPEGVAPFIYFQF